MSVSEAESISLFFAKRLAIIKRIAYNRVKPKYKNEDFAAQFYIVEISEDNRVRVLPYNLMTDDFFQTADGRKREKRVQLLLRVLF